MTTTNLLSPEIPGRKRYRMIQNVLDQNGLITHIARVKKKHFELIVNGVVEKQYRNRSSANQYLVKLYKQQQ